MNSANSTTRRAAIGAIAAAAVMPTATTIAKTPEADPAFAAIARHKQTLAAFLDVIREDDATPLDEETDPAGIAYKERWEAAHEVNEAAIWAICEVEPTTLAGIAALAAYGAEIYNDEISGLANAETLLESIATAAKRLVERAS